MYLADSGKPDPHDEKAVWTLCGRYPTTWNIYQGNEDYNMYIIEQGDSGRVLDLFSANVPNNPKLCTYPKGDWVAWKRWRFERLSDDTGEVEIQARDQLISKYKDQLAAKDAEVVHLQKQLESQSQELNQLKHEVTQTSGNRGSFENQCFDLLLTELRMANRRYEDETAALRNRLDRFEHLASQASIPSLLLQFNTHFLR
ncbi:ricin-type beta-trefoil lectin domain protein [Ceratobasidium sp. AG-Ba]|nr:ricin-type beta-trefoil lectin domain protein [Ceratobasidium sp. AG-Ba]